MSRQQLRQGQMWLSVEPGFPWICRSLSAEPAGQDSPDCILASVQPSWYWDVGALCLYRIDLIKRLRRNVIGNRRIFHRKIICIAQMDIIRDIRHAPDTFRALSKNNIGALGIYIIRNRGHPRKHRKPFDERVFLWQPVSVNHQTYHHFFGGKSIADQNMAHQPGSGSLIVSPGKSCADILLLYTADSNT